MDSMGSSMMPTKAMAALTGTMTSMAAMATGNSSMSGMDGMSGMGGMDMVCEMSMLWNWYTVGTCFLSGSWYITSVGMFVGSCFGVVGLVISLEFLRRAQREYESFSRRRQQQDYRSWSSRERGNGADARSAPEDIDLHGVALAKGLPVRVSTRRYAESWNSAASIGRSGPISWILLQRHLIRATLHMLQFAVAYFIMLLAMYFNGYIIISIFIGAWLGYFIFAWDTTLASSNAPQGPQQSEEVTGCCG